MTEDASAVNITVSAKDFEVQSPLYLSENNSAVSMGISGILYESGFGYDSNSAISGYNGSAFAGGGGGGISTVTTDSSMTGNGSVASPLGISYPLSPANNESTASFNQYGMSINDGNGMRGVTYESIGRWDETHDTVSANSGTWGGSALPISAGPGIKLEMVNNTLVASTDETLLWSGNAGFGEMPITLSESMNNFENIEITWIPRYNGDYGSPTRVDKLSTNSYNGNLQWTLGGFYRNAGSNWLGYVYLSANNTSTILTHDSSFYINPATTAAPGNNLAFRVCKIVGINRKA